MSLVNARIRELHRMATRGDELASKKLIATMLAQASPFEWEQEAASGSPIARHWLISLWVEGFDFPGQNWINFYEDSISHSTAVVYSANQALKMYRWLSKFIVANKLFYQGETVYDVVEKREVVEAPGKIVATVTDSPNFTFEAPDENERGHSRIDLPGGGRDRYVDLVLVDDIGETEDGRADALPPADDSERDIVPDDNAGDDYENYWVNAYSISQSYGGPEEGGWWRTVHEPLASIYVGPMQNKHVRHVRNRPKHVQRLIKFLSKFYIPARRDEGRYLIWPEIHPAYWAGGPDHYE